MNFILEEIIVFTFIENRNYNKDYIEFFPRRMCRSSAGRDGGRQYIFLFEYCAEEHTLIHEVHFCDSKNRVNSG